MTAFVGRSPLRPKVMPEQQKTTTTKKQRDKQKAINQDDISEELFLVFVNEAFRASGLTQKEAATALEVTQPAVNMALRGSFTHRAIMIRIVNAWHPTLQVEEEPVLRYRMKRRDAS